MHRPGRRAFLRSLRTESFPRQRPAAEHLGNYWCSFRWFVDPTDRSELCICPECRRLPRCDPGCTPVETNKSASKARSGELFGIFRDGYPLRSLCARASDCVGTERLVRAVHLSDSGILAPTPFRVEMLVPSWNEHLRQQERMAKGEKDVLDKAWSLHLGPDPPEERIYLVVNRELDTPRQGLR
jgi:hypothetical protein